MLSIVPSNQFKRDLKLAKKRGFDLSELREVVNTLAREQPLEEKHHDHELTAAFGSAISSRTGCRSTARTATRWSCICSEQGRTRTCSSELCLFRIGLYATFYFCYLVLNFLKISIR